MVGSVKRAPKFIKAKNEEELHQKIIELQIKTHKEYSFIAIYPLGRGIVAWYYDIDDSVTLLKELMGAYGKSN